MIAETAQYVVTVGTATVTICSGIFGLIRLKMRLKFYQYVVDRAADQDQLVDAVAIIELTTPRISLRRSRGGNEVPKVTGNGPDVDRATTTRESIAANAAAGVRPPEPLALPVARIKRIIGRALRVPQRTANDGRERAAAVTRNAGQIRK